MKHILTTLVLLSGLTLSAQTKSIHQNLKRVQIDTSYSAFFNYDDKSCVLLNMPCHKLAKTDTFRCTDGEELAYWTKLGLYKTPQFKDTLVIIYTDGMSADPQFTLATKQGKELMRVNATDFSINSTGIIYTSGHTNNMYNKRRKFVIQQDTALEVKQPYYYVGLKGKLLKSATLYRDKTGKDIVASLSKDYEIEILLAESTSKDFEMEYLFLARTEFGLVGWLRLSNTDLDNSLLEGLYYAGD
ncbi:MAG TPA: hypothetical protein VK154_07315 [Chitinophagales bacterium]|nr:hypothetical protein [Chitinophagales bacterium]